MNLDAILLRSTLIRAGQFLEKTFVNSLKAIEARKSTARAAGAS
jgi:hypothetical protein